MTWESIISDFGDTITSDSLSLKETILKLKSCLIGGL